MAAGKCADCGCKIPFGKKYCSDCYAYRIEKYRRKKSNNDRSVAYYNSLSSSERERLDAKANKRILRIFTFSFFFFAGSFLVILGEQNKTPILEVIGIIIPLFGIFATVKLHRIFGMITKILLFGTIVGYILSLLADCTGQFFALSEGVKNVIIIICGIIGFVGAGIFAVMHKFTVTFHEPIMPSNKGEKHPVDGTTYY